MRTRYMAAAVLALGLAGCETGTEPATGEARMAVAVRGDTPSGANASRSAADGSAAEATLEVEARVWVQSEAGRWMEVTRGAARQTVEASGRDGARLLATGEVEAGSYRRVRVEFERVEARSESGIRIGAGLLTGVVRVELGGDGRTVVERRIALEARARSQTELEVDLNADQWLGRADVQSRTVAESEFQGAVRVLAR